MNVATMPRHMTASARRAMRAMAVVASIVGPAAAWADCPKNQTAASCALHDEAVAAFTAGKYDVAATKFRAAIAAGPTARSYLGYSQCVEEQGKVALAYETMLVAQKLSAEELAAPGGKDDPAIVGRAERIKYKLGELAAKTAQVWLRLPEGVSPARVRAVYREGEGDLPSPIGRWIVVAPARQVLHATLDDGTKLQVVATVAAGAQGTVVIPVPVAQPVAPAPASTATTAPTAPNPATTNSTTPAPPVDAPAPEAPRGPPSTVFAVNTGVVFREFENIGVGLGFGLAFERKLASRVAATARTGVLFHPSQDTDISPIETASISATEWMLTVGARTRSKLPIYATVEVGVLGFSSESRISVPAMEDRVEKYSHRYPAFIVGGGVRLGKVCIEALMLATGGSGDVDIPPRFFATFGVDLVRR